MAGSNHAGFGFVTSGEIGTKASRAPNLAIRRPAWVFRWFEVNDYPETEPNRSSTFFALSLITVIMVCVPFVMGRDPSEPMGPSSIPTWM